MASMQEQLKHIRDANDDWHDEHTRSVSTPLTCFPVLAVAQRTDIFLVDRLIGDLTQLSQGNNKNPSQSSTPQPGLLFESRSGESS